MSHKQQRHKIYLICVITNNEIWYKNTEKNLWSLEGMQCLVLSESVLINTPVKNISLIINILKPPNSSMF